VDIAQQRALGYEHLVGMLRPGALTVPEKTKKPQAGIKIFCPHLPSIALSEARGCLLTSRKGARKKE
jgi:hypothetical protein